MISGYQYIKMINDSETDYVRVNRFWQVEDWSQQNYFYGHYIRHLGLLTQPNSYQGKVLHHLLDFKHLGTSAGM